MPEASSAKEPGAYRDTVLTTEPSIDLTRALGRSHAFIGLDADQLVLIEPLITVRTFRAGDVVVERDSRECDLHLILEGEVRVMDPEGGHMADLGTGASVGEVALMDQQPRSATVISKGDTIIGSIRAMDLWMLMDDRPEIGKTVLFNIGRVLAARLRSANQS